MASTFEVVLNRNARRLRAGGPLARRLEAASASAGARLHLTASVEDLERIAHEIAARETDAVILAGGDGSIMAGLSALARAYRGRTWPRVAFAPAGTVSTIARNFGLAGDGGAERVIRAVAAHRARVVAWPTLRVHDDAATRIGFIFGAGLVARFFALYAASPRRGLAYAAQIAARVFAGSFVGAAFARQVLTPVPCSLEVDGTLQPPRAFSLIVASVLLDLGLHLRVTYRAGEEDTRFHLVASGLPPRDLGPQLPRVLAGRPLRGDARVDALAASSRVDFAESPGAYVLDGDVFATRSVTVEAGPLLSILLPA